MIIVGAGSAGCVLAARLSENEARRVLLVEAGPDFETIEDFPAGLALASSTPVMAPGHPRSWNFVGELSAEQTAYPIDRGKVIGGSSAINGTVFIRGRRPDFEHWAALGNDLWSFEQVLPYFKKSERDLNFAGEFHGQDGPMPVSRPVEQDARRVVEAFTEACIAAGFPEEPDKNTPGVEGVGPIPRNVHYGIRMNTAVTYLTPSVRSRTNLTVLCDTFVRRVVFEGTRAVGVETERDGQPVAFGADQVILCAGGIKSPHLLMLSGIGPADALRNTGIPVVHDSPGVGRNVKDHPTVFLMAQVAGDVLLPEHVLMCHTALHHTAPGSNDTSDLEISWGRFQSMLMLNVALNVEKSSGEIFLNSSDPAAAPAINLNYLSDPDDLPRMTANLRLALELLQAPAFEPLKVELLNPASADTSDAALRGWIRSNLASCLHTHSSTAMGPASDANAVVDQRCNVHGVERLRVADVGIIPSIRHGPAATAVMIGERVADLVNEDDK